MGNCCGSEEDVQKTKAFQGDGHRLGTAAESNNNAKENTPLVTSAEEEEVPKAVVNPNLTDDDRERQRANRLAAAEARMKQPAKKKPKKPSEPLRGPNSKPTMTWNLG